MADEKQQRYRVFKLLLIIGGLLGVLLLVQSVRSYTFVSERLVAEELFRDSARHASFVVEAAREAGVERPEDLQPVLEKVLVERAREIAWIRLFNLRGDVYARAGSRSIDAFPDTDLRRLFESGDRIVKVTEADSGRALVNIRPFRFRWGTAWREQLQPVAPGERRAGGPVFIELGLHWEGVGPEFGGLQRAMFIQVSAAVALVAAMVFIGVRFQSFLRGKQLERQLEVARNVQQDLLPTNFGSPANLDVAAICEPAWQVGGDFYDIFHSSNDRVALILGDVSGKGLPAALLMGMLHGAVRSSYPLTERLDIEEATRRLNELMYDATSVERFVTMFWCQYDPKDRMLRYVNAGHLAPYIVHRRDPENPAISRLSEGGPVLGVIPSAHYVQGVVPFSQGDLLVIYSDGVVEAEGTRGEEFGEERLAEAIRRNAGRPAVVVRDAIVAEVRKFAHGAPQADDLTLLVVRAGAAVGPRESLATSELQVV